jgi:hypothetical protein
MRRQSINMSIFSMDSTFEVERPSGYENARQCRDRRGLRVRFTCLNLFDCSDVGWCVFSWFTAPIQSRSCAAGKFVRISLEGCGIHKKKKIRQILLCRALCPLLKSCWRKIKKKSIVDLFFPRIVFSRARHLINERMVGKGSGSSQCE